MQAMIPPQSRAFGSEIKQQRNANFPVNAQEEEEENEPEDVPTERKDSDCASHIGSEVSSVSQLRSFLDNFGKNNREHFERNNLTTARAGVQHSPVRRPKVRPSVPTGPTPLPDEAANALVRRLMKPGRPRVIRKFDNDDVQATDEGRAPVAKLSKWLADDPTTKKKNAQQLRRGANILSKAKVFDKGLTNVIAQENQIQRGSVSAHKHRFESFHNEKSSDCGTALDKTKRLTGAFVRPLQRNEARSEIVTHSDRDEYANLAKQKWRHQRTTTVALTETVEETISAKLVEETQEEEQIDEKVDPEEVENKSPSHDNWCDSDDTESKASGSTSTTEVTECTQVEAKSGKKTPKKSVTFRVAREALVQRSKTNSVDVLVQRRKAKFEKLEKEYRRKTGTTGLLRTSWEEEQRGSYVKKYRENIPRKKSLSDLP